MAMPKLDESAIFNAARQIASAEARRQYLQEACGDDRTLHARVEALLRVHEEEQSFLEPSPHPAFSSPESRLGGGVSERPGVQVGPYKLVEQIGEGGFGVVFMAEQQQPI